jgi:PhnB protein
MAKLVAYLSFEGKCREAMTFYNECFGGEMTLQTYGDSPAGSQVPASMKNMIMHSQLKKGDMILMGSDIMEGDKLKKGNSINLCLICSSKEEIESLFSKFASDGKIGHPLKEEFFGTYGDLTDRYGNNWLFQYSKNPQP